MIRYRIPPSTSIGSGWVNLILLMSFLLSPQQYRLLNLMKNNNFLMSGPKIETVKQYKFMI